MKKVLAVAMVLMLALSVSAFAGPFIGPAIVPDIGASVGFVVGWDFSKMHVEVLKSDLSTFYGDWLIGALWTPEADGYAYRAGIRMLLEWTGPLVYEGFGFVVGVSKTWEPFQLYAELDIFPTGTLVAFPVIGFNFLFDTLGGDDVTEEVLE